MTERDELAARLRAAGCVYAEDEARLLRQAAAEPALEQLVARRIAGEPLEQVVGWAEFAGLRIELDAGVFVPRMRSEVLAAAALQCVRARAEALDAPVVVVDLCCGSGAIAAAVASGGFDVELHASDIDPRAVRCARRNLEPLGGTVHEGSLFEALPPRLAGRVDVVVANVPYVPTSEVALLPREAREHEPIATLDGGADGLELLRAVAHAAPRWLAREGVVLFETALGQAQDATAALREASLEPSCHVDDDLEVCVVTGRRSSAPSARAAHPGR